MPMLSYTLDGAESKIAAGTKTSTIREYTAQRFDRYADAWMKGRRLYHYVHPRTPQMRLIAITDIESVEFFNFPKSPVLPEKLAKADGFDSAEEMYEWFAAKYGACFWALNWIRITWNPPEAVE